MKKKVGFFGGTFDPIHIGHLNLAIQILEMKKLDEILFCPAHISPFKQENPPKASPQQRLQMVRLAIEEIPEFHFTTLEIDRDPPSYSFDTLSSLVEKEGKQKDFFLILAESTAYSIDRWEKGDELIKLASPLIGTRFGLDEIKIKSFPPPIKVAIENGGCKIMTMDVSSTLIRERLKKKLYCGHLLPRKVLDYIYENRLYFI